MAEPTHLKNMLVKLAHFPNFRGENKKCLFNHPLEKKDPFFIAWSAASPCNGKSKGPSGSHGTNLGIASGRSLDRAPPY